MTSKKAARKKLLISPKFQLRFIGIMMTLSAAVIFMLYSAERYFFWKFHQLGELFGLPQSNDFYQYLNQQELFMNQIFGVVSILVFILISLVGLIYSFRISGPIYRLEQHFRSIASGKHPSTISFRRKDNFSELAEAYNSMIKSFQGKQSK